MSKTKKAVKKKKPAKVPAALKGDRYRIDQICQLMNGSLTPKGVTPETLFERVSGLIVSLNIVEKKHQLLQEYLKA